MPAKPQAIGEPAERHLRGASSRLQPMQIIANGQPRDIPDGTTVAALLDALKLADKPVAVEVNLELVPRQQHAGHRLAEGDRVEIVTLVGGG